jgi:hypothetical protein
MVKNEWYVEILIRAGSMKFIPQYTITKLEHVRREGVLK